jgi:hypothetical protein
MGGGPTAAREMPLSHFALDAQLLLLRNGPQLVRYGSTSSSEGAVSTIRDPVHSSRSLSSLVGS